MYKYGHMQISIYALVYMVTNAGIHTYTHLHKHIHA